MQDQVQRPFFALPHQLARLLTLFLGTLQGNTPTAATLRLSREADSILLETPHGLDVEGRKWLAHHEAALASQALGYAARLTVSPDRLRLTLPFEPARDHAECYSVLA